MKTCRLCKTSKPLDEFGSSSQRKDGKHWACRLCWNAYVNSRRWANGTKPEQPLLNRLWDNIQQCGHGDICLYCCWPWSKGCDQDGYGRISINNQGIHLTYVVSRIVYEIWHAIFIPSDVAVAHYCDNPPCANPTHLWLGSWNDNRQDCVKKGRHAQGETSGHVTHPEAFPRGEAHFKAKLTAAQVLAIRTRYTAGGITMQRLADQYGVSDFAIMCIIHRRTWKHV